MRLVRWLAARPKTAYLLLGYAVFLLFLAIFGARVPATVVSRIAALPPFPILYAAVALHLAACLVTFWPVLRQRVSLEPPADEEGARIARIPADVAAAARRHGLRPAGERAFARFRFSPAGTFVFHAALLLLPVAWLVSRATRFSGEAWIVEGHPFGGAREEYAESEGAAPPRVAFDVEDVTAEFWGDRLFFTDLVATVRGPGEEAPRTLRLPQPARIGGARVSIKGFNYTPAVEVRGPGGEVLESADANLWLFPPGTEDSFGVPGLPYRFFVRLYPDADGAPRPKNRGHALASPLFHVAVTSGKRLVTHGWIRPGDPLLFDGFTLRLPAIRKGGRIAVHRDLGEPVLWTALVLMLGGAAARIAFPSVRVWLIPEGGGARVVAREDVFGRGRADAFLAELESA